MLKRGMHICLISGSLSRRNAMLLPTIVDDIDHGVSDDYKSVNVSFYRYVGVDRSVIRVFNENISSSKPFEKNNTSSNNPFFVEEEISQFYNSENRITIFELNSFDSSLKGKEDNEIDAVYFSYVCLLLHKLEKQGRNFYFFVSGMPNELERYTKVSSDDYHRLRTFLFLEMLYGINSRIYVLPSFANIWVNLYQKETVASIEDVTQDTKEIMSDKDFGKILPLISINKETYRAFHKKPDKTGFNQTTSVLEFRLHELLNCYISKLEQLFDSKEMQILSESMACDNLFEAILFVSTLYYIVIDNKKLTIEIEKMHEKCMDYAQGIFQIIENSYYHVVKDNSAGWGNVSFRIRKTESNSNKFSFDYDIYVTDLSNLSKEQIGIACNFTKNYPELQKSNISLDDIFYKTENADLINFLSKNDNIAHHYGLMILNNAIKSNSGFIRVRSGVDLYVSDKKRTSKNYMPWAQGTTFFIRIPINVNIPEKSHLDTIGSPNLSMSGSKFQIIPLNASEVFPSGYYCFNSSTEKVEFINSLEKSLSKFMIYSRTIYTIDCRCYDSEIEFEILAKTLFLILSNNAYVNNIALINLIDKHFVIKLFRQFALFYDRKGKNRYLSNKRIFLVDEEANLALLLMGHIGDVIQELYSLELSGQIDETAIAIINCLGRWVDESKKIQ